MKALKDQMESTREERLKKVEVHRPRLCLWMALRIERRTFSAWLPFAEPLLLTFWETSLVRCRLKVVWVPQVELQMEKDLNECGLDETLERVRKGLLTFIRLGGARRVGAEHIVNSQFSI